MSLPTGARLNCERSTAGGSASSTISGTPSGYVTVGTSYGFTPAASDPEGATLSFSITNKPPWASFSSTTGRLSGTPTAAAEGVHVDIVIRVSDGKLTAELPAFDPLLDAIAFSRGRMAVTLAGGSSLVVPAWPEPARTVEDCRN